MKVKTISLLQENRILGLCKYFLPLHKILITKEKNDKSDYIKSESVSLLKETILNRKVTE